VDHILTIPPISSPLFLEAKTTYEGLSRQLKDLDEYQIPRLRDCKGTLTLQQQYAAELRDDTEALAKRMEVGTRACWSVHQLNAKTIRTFLRLQRTRRRKTNVLMLNDGSTTSMMSSRGMFK
jgi:hypothetical protein